MADITAPTAHKERAKPRGKPFKKGQSGNPAGRIPGSRNRFSEAFLSDLADDFQANGPDVFKAVRESDPAAYLRVAATVLPKHSQIELKDDLDHLSDSQLNARLEALQKSMGVKVVPINDE